MITLNVCVITLLQYNNNKTLNTSECSPSASLTLASECSPSTSLTLETLWIH